jgi:hypothetical protein
MNRRVSLFASVLLLPLLLSCSGTGGGPVALPDLVPHTPLAGMDAGKFEVKFIVKNIGAGPTTRVALVYVEAINPTPPAGESDIRLQASYEIPVLIAGAESTGFYTFWEPAQLATKGVTLIRVTVDVKGEIRESVETNNIKEWPYPCGTTTSACP